MVKVTFEVWKTATGVGMFRRGAKGWKESLKPPIHLLHTYEAETLFSAFQTYYDLMGWGKWKTEGLEDRVFTEEDVTQADDRRRSEVVLVRFIS